MNRTICMGNEAHDTNIVANYLMANGESVLIRERTQDTRHYTQTEWEQLSNYAPIGMSGFGFVYLHHPLDYTFYADRVGEDIHFWWDHPSLELHAAKQIQLGACPLIRVSSRINTTYTYCEQIITTDVVE